MWKTDSAEPSHGILIVHPQPDKSAPALQNKTNPPAVKRLTRARQKTRMAEPLSPQQRQREAIASYTWQLICKMYAADFGQKYYLLNSRATFLHNKSSDSSSNRTSTINPEFLSHQNVVVFLLFLLLL